MSTQTIQRPKEVARERPELWLFYDKISAEMREHLVADTLPSSDSVSSYFAQGVKYSQDEGLYRANDFYLLLLLKEWGEADLSDEKLAKQWLGVWHRMVSLHRCNGIRNFMWLKFREELEFLYQAIEKQDDEDGYPIENYDVTAEIVELSKKMKDCVNPALLIKYTREIVGNPELLPLNHKWEIASLKKAMVNWV